jgi:hypothetical protein
VQLKVWGGAAVGAVAVVAGAVIAQADGTKAALTGGLAMQNGLVERQAVAGAQNTVKVLNNSDQALTVAVTPRRWTQSSSGLVSPNRRSRLSTVGVSEREFTLAPGASRDVTVTLKTGVPQYGALEIVGLPTDVAKRKGIVTGYRLVGALRYKPATPSYALKPGSVKVTSGMLTLSVRSTGNTPDAVSGSVRLKGPLGTRQGSIRATRLLPGKSIRLALISAKRLPAGRYTASVSLKQGTLRTSLTKTIRVTGRG